MLLFFVALCLQFQISCGNSINFLSCEERFKYLEKTLQNKKHKKIQEKLTVLLKNVEKDACDKNAEDFHRAAQAIEWFLENEDVFRTQHDVIVPTTVTHTPHTTEKLTPKVAENKKHITQATQVRSKCCAPNKTVHLASFDKKKGTPSKKEKTK